MKLIVDFNMGWRKLLVAPKDFVTLAEIFDRSEVVDTAYCDNSGPYLIKEEGCRLSCQQNNQLPITRDEFNAIRDAEQLAKNTPEMPNENPA